MPNQNQWSVFKRLLTYLKPYKFLTFLALTFHLVHNGYQEYHSLGGLLFY